MKAQSMSRDALLAEAFRHADEDIRRLAELLIDYAVGMEAGVAVEAIFILKGILGRAAAVYGVHLEPLNQHGWGVEVPLALLLEDAEQCCGKSTRRGADLADRDACAHLPAPGNAPVPPAPPPAPECPCPALLALLPRRKA